MTQLAQECSLAFELGVLVPYLKLKLLFWLYEPLAQECSRAIAGSFLVPVRMAQETKRANPNPSFLRQRGCESQIIIFGVAYIKKLAATFFANF